MYFEFHDSLLTHHGRIIEGLFLNSSMHEHQKGLDLCGFSLFCISLNTILLEKHNDFVKNLYFDDFS